MPTRQTHRGRHPEDDKYFSFGNVARLRDAVHDLSFLYTRGYSEDAGVAMVGNRYQLAARQRRAVRSAACSDAAKVLRRKHGLAAGEVRGGTVCIDGYNVLIGVESALSGAYLFKGRDGYVRDLASLHGSYRRVAETLAALELIGATLDRLQVRKVQWYFDAPVSNSGRLKALASELANGRGWPWTVDLAANVDGVVADFDGVAATADSWILDRAPRALPLLNLALERMRTNYILLDFSDC